MNLIKFILKQINDIKKGGIKRFFKKVKIFFLFIITSPLYILSISLVLLVRTGSLFVTLRFLPLDFSRIGGIYRLLWYLRLKKTGEFKYVRSFDLLFIESKFKHNKQWLKLWKRSIFILPFSFLWKQFYSLNKLFSGFKKYEIPFFESLLTNPNCSKVNQKLVLDLKTNPLEKITEIEKPFIYFKKNEIEIGNSYLKKIGTFKYNFICFHSRDPAYTNQIDSDRDWSYHNFRNTNISNYLSAMREMSKKEFYSFRMGSVVSSKLEYINSNIIDYASSKERSDFLDIYLCSRCYFFVSGADSGLSVIPETFKRPIVYVNWPGIITMLAHVNNSLFIPKKFYSVKDQRLLTFNEIIKSGFENKGFNNNASTKLLEKMNIKLLENTPDEITDVVLEMHARLNGTWKSNEKDEILQKRFWSLFKHTFLKSPTCRIGSNFLKKNQQLLL